MAKKYKPIDELASNFAAGVTADAAKEKWSERAAGAVEYYKDNFGPVYSAQTSCGAEVKGKGLAGYDALKSYAECMARRMKRGGT